MMDAASSNLYVFTTKLGHVPKQKNDLVMKYSTFQLSKLGVKAHIGLSNQKCTARNGVQKCF